MVKSVMYKLIEYFYYNQDEEVTRRDLENELNISFPAVVEKLELLVVKGFVNKRVSKGKHNFYRAGVKVKQCLTADEAFKLISEGIE